MTDDTKLAQSSKKPRTEPKRDWLIIAFFVVASGAYFIFVVWLLAASKPCDAAKNVEGFLQRIASIPACRSANEIGDLLSGSFAPLAFLWLVAAVLIQSKELSAQRQELVYTREELELTREEMASQRKVMEAQAVESKKQAEFVGEQTQILKRKHELEEMDRHNNEFSDSLESLYNAIVTTRPMTVYYNGIAGQFDIYTITIAQIEKFSHDEIIRIAAGRCIDTISSLPNDFVDMTPLNKEAYEIILSRLGRLLSKLDKVDSATISIASDLKLADFHSALITLKSRFKA